MNNEYFIYKLSDKKEKTLFKQESIRCYYCNSSRNFDLVNNRCNNCSRIIGYSKYTSGMYPKGINCHEIPAVKRRYKYEKAEIDKRLVESNENEEISSCYCLIV
jgi:hypothetical protein